MGADPAIPVRVVELDAVAEENDPEGSVVKTPEL